MYIYIYIYEYIPADVYLRVPKKDEGGYLPYRNVYSEKPRKRALISCKTRVEGLLPNARRRCLMVWFQGPKTPFHLGVASFAVS